jgi:uncharacterized membrane protein
MTSESWASCCSGAIAATRPADRGTLVPTGRLEAFSDGVITIMVLELHTPVGTSWRALGHDLPVLFAYALSFVYLGIYWNNHHHMLAVVSRVTGWVALGVYVVVALIWLVPDRRVERHVSATAAESQE